MVFRFMVKNLPAIVGDSGLISGSGRPSGEGNGNPLQYSCLENPKDRGAWQATVHGVTKGWTQLSLHAHKFWSPKEVADIFISYLSFHRYLEYHLHALFQNHSI